MMDFYWKFKSASVYWCLYWFTFQQNDSLISMQRILCFTKSNFGKEDKPKIGSCTDAVKTQSEPVKIQL